MTEKQYHYVQSPGITKEMKASIEQDPAPHF